MNSSPQKPHSKGAVVTLRSQGFESQYELHVLKTPTHNFNMGVISDLFNGVRYKKKLNTSHVERNTIFFFFNFFARLWSFESQQGDFLDFCKYYIQHCFICCPSDSTVSEDGIDPRTLALAVRRSYHSAMSHPL